MILVDTALQAREAAGRPLRVGMLGAGVMGRALANQIIHSVPGMRLVAVFGRDVDRAVRALHYAGSTDIAVAESAAQFADAVRRGRTVVTADSTLVTGADEIDVIVDVTGSVEFGARAYLDAFDHGKHVVMMNAEVDATIGPILQTYAQRAGVILSACDGDEPGLQANLFRWVKGLGLTPRVVGNVKGLQDPYRNPSTQHSFAERYEQNVAMVTSFADGSKLSFEQTIVANATGFGVRTRGMSRGLAFNGPISDLVTLYDIDELRALGGIIDYTVGPPGAKVFVLAEHEDPKQRHYLDYYKMGPGPLYAFWAPYHLVHFETPNAIARVALFGDNVAPPLGGPVVEVCAVAKRDLRAGEILDDYGRFMTYGEAANTDEMSTGRYLPEGLVEGCVLVRDVAKDAVLTYDDVSVPPGRISDVLRAEQYRFFRGETWLADHLTGAARAMP